LVNKLSSAHQQLLDNYSATITEGSRQLRSARVWHFLQFIGDKKTPTSDDVKAWLKNLEKKDKSAGTIKEHYNILSKFFKVNKLEWSFTPEEKPIYREEDQYAPALDPDDIQIMVEVARGQRPSETIPPKSHHRAFLCIATIWGLRRAELAAIMPEDINLEQRAIYIHTIHRGRARYHLVPELAVPFLEEWDFNHRLGVDALSKIFVELREMSGIPDLIFVSWHAIRRSCVQAAWRARFTQPEIHSFYRWKRGTSPDQALRYAESRVVGRKGEVVGPGLWDRALDQQFYERHPFMEFWK